MAKLEDYQKRVLKDYTDVEVYEKQIEDGVVLVIMRGGLNQANPKPYMDGAVADYVQHDSFNEFIEVFLDNPWIRVLIFGINNLHNNVRWRNVSCNPKDDEK